MNLVYVQGVEIDVSDIDAELVAQLESGLQVKVTGQYTGPNSLKATKVELFSGNGESNPPTTTADY